MNFWFANDIFTYDTYSYIVFIYHEELFVTSTANVQIKLTSFIISQIKVCTWFIFKKSF